MTKSDRAMLIKSLFAAMIFAALVPGMLKAAEPPGKWEIRAPMPTARTEVAAVELGGQIYVMGGYEKNGDLVEAYDPKQNSWRRRAPLPRALHHLGAASIAGKIYVIGGYISGAGSVDTVYEYDSSADRWRVRASRIRCTVNVAPCPGTD